MFIPFAAAAASLEGYMGTPLFDYSVMGNRLPAGEFTAVRSYRGITQLLFSTHMKAVLYTDRDNTADSEITVSAYNLFENRKIEGEPMTQHEFNLAVERLIRKGDAVSESIRFPGGDSFISEIIKGLKPENNDGEHYIYIKNSGRPDSLMTVNIFWKKLTLRNMKKSDGTPTSFYSIYIDQCYDKNIKRIIREYASIIKKQR